MYMHTLNIYSVVKKIEVDPYVQMWKDLQDIVHEKQAKFMIHMKWIYSIYVHYVNL